jgi:hypothetical protein
LQCNGAKADDNDDDDDNNDNNHDSYINVDLNGCNDNKTKTKKRQLSHMIFCRQSEGGSQTLSSNGPIIYFNHKCFSGPLLSKSRLSEVPRSVGPGPVHLVMKEVLSRLISVAYKPSKVLRELQQEGAPNPSMTPQILKAK